MAAVRLLVLVTSLVTLCTCHKNFTVTFVAKLELEVKNYNGQGDDISHELVVGIFGDTAPITALNFKTLCTGWERNSRVYKYEHSFCHRLVKDMLMQCGDVTTGDGTGSISIYGNRFNDENFHISHRGGGIISMANHGRDTNGSQFFITFGPSRFLDGKHVAFGKLLKGYEVLKALNKMGPGEDYATPKRPIRINGCEIEDRNLELSEKQMEKHEDIDK
ncbi:uncharacterized protein LOC143297256 [Babylonia areolata]|uniref:uncharacterized protein LOC143297256 n=1 Tax=Babylonia areolata TaxID=304850 RepID=UPI003FD20B85